MKKLLIPLLVAVSFILGYFGGRYSGRLPRARSGVAKSEAVLGPWKASFHIPGPGIGSDAERRVLSSSVMSQGRP